MYAIRSYYVPSDDRIDEAGDRVGVEDGETPDLSAVSFDDLPPHHFARRDVLALREDIGSQCVEKDFRRGLVEEDDRNNFV